METAIHISFDRENAIYQAQTQLSGQIAFETLAGIPVKKVELAILWHTMGKGTEDSGLIHFAELLQDSDLTSSTTLPFATRLPALPLSYQGRLLKIYWVVRVRVFPKQGRQFGAEARFMVVAPEGETSL